MIAPSQLPEQYRKWNQRWRAPFGGQTMKRVLPRSLWLSALGARSVGPFAFQSNNVSRTIEYPWAFFEGNLAAGLTVMDLGAGFSGFPFVLSREGMQVFLVDPFIQYAATYHYPDDPSTMMRRLNAAFGTRVVLKHGTIEAAGFADAAFDRVFCISAIEHMPAAAIEEIAAEVPRLLRPGGLFVLSIDLFLNLTPFSARSSNEFGTNISVRDFVARTGLRIRVGKPEELYGFSDFRAEAIMARLEAYHVSTPYPALTQLLVLEKV